MFDIQRVQVALAQSHREREALKRRPSPSADFLALIIGDGSIWEFFDRAKVSAVLRDHPRFHVGLSLRRAEGQRP